MGHVYFDDRKEYNRQYYIKNKNRINEARRVKVSKVKRSLMGGEFKECPSCFKVKSKDDYYRCRTKERSSKPWKRQSTCKECIREINRFLYRKKILGDEWVHLVKA